MFADRAGRMAHNFHDLLQKYKDSGVMPTYNQFWLIDLMEIPAESEFFIKLFPHHDFWVHYDEEWFKAFP